MDSSPGSSVSHVFRAPHHLNSSGLRIEYAEGKGRGVYACREIPAQTVIEISPVLLFNADEYREHGRHTVLDHYTFVWRDGRMALALGLGSLFNHSQRPNVSYSIDTATESIRFTTSRMVQQNEELCIFYGHKLWFDPVDVVDRPESSLGSTQAQDDGWRGPFSNSLWDLEEGELVSNSELSAFMRCGDGPDDQVLLEGELPFQRLKLTPEEDDEEVMEAVRKEDAWAVDLPDPRFAATMLKWLKQAGLDTPSMSHLKRIRKIDDRMSMVLILTREHPEPPSFPPHIELPPPYTTAVPRTAALTVTSLKLKSTLWPTIYAPRKKFEPEPWTRSKVRWAYNAMKETVKIAQAAGKRDETPIAAYVPLPYDEESRTATRMLHPIGSHDTRRSASHPLRHSIMNLVRAIGELRAASTSVVSLSESPSTSPPPQLTPIVEVPAAERDDNSSTFSQPHTQPIATKGGPHLETTQDDARNGAHYLLTSLTLFTTHEPCIMCSMALLHSRVKEVFYLIPMKKTGGCGGLTCVPRLEGVNHRYAVNIWKTDGDSLEEWSRRLGLDVDEACDA